MTGHVAVPPIPATLAGRPVVGGLVQPWLNVALADGGVDFRAQHQARAALSWTHGLCQVCGGLIEPPAVLLGGPDELRKLLFGEPPLHPECAFYTSKACPMVAGRMDQHPERARVSTGGRGRRCPVPGCDCGGWVPTAGLQHRGGREGQLARAWFAVWVRALAPAAMADSPQHTTNGVVQPSDVIRIVQVSAPGEGRVWRRLDVDEALADYEPPQRAEGGAR